MGLWLSPAAAFRLGCPTSYGSLTSQPGMKPKLSALEGGCLTTGQEEKSLQPYTLLTRAMVGPEPVQDKPEGAPV